MSPVDDPIAVLTVSPARRIFGTGLLVALGALLLWIWLTLPDKTLLATLVFAGVGGLALWQAQRFHQATARSIVLSAAGLTDSTGEVIAEMGNIASVDRGAFAFKPSNGFTVRLKSPAPRAWLPGLWWRLGRRVGVGGATPGKAARDMADVITILLKDPDVARRQFDPTDD